MKKIFALLLTIIMCFTVADVMFADNAKITVAETSASASQDVCLTVELSNCNDPANTLGIVFDYDSEVLTKDASQTKWLKEGTIADFEKNSNRGVWAVKTASKLDGAVCQLGFHVNEDAPVGETEVKVTLIVKNDSTTIGTYETTAVVSVVGEDEPEQPCEHTYGAWEKADDENHVRTCTECQEKETAAHEWNSGEVVKEATATEDGTMRYTCTVCSATRDEVIKATGTPENPEQPCEHTYGAWEKADDTNHARTCTKCQAKETAAHVWDNGVVKVEASATKDGVKVYTCTTCKATKEEVIKATGTPEDTQKPSDTTKPEDTQKPSDTTKPEDTQKPSDTTKPEDTQKPSDTTKPQKPSDTNKPSDEDTTDDETTDVPETSGVKLDTMVVTNKVAEITEAEAGTEVVVEMKNSDGTVATVVPVEILEAISGKDVDVVLDMGDYSWTINGQNVTATELAAINLEVALDTQAVAEDVVNEIANGDETLQITLQHNGDFGFEASLSLNVGKDYAGEYGNLYYYDNGTLVFMNAGLIDENGNVTLTFTHASDYVIVIGQERTADTPITEPEDTIGTEEPDDNNSGTKEPTSNGGGIFVVIVLIAILAVGVVFFVKKKFK